jgi:hypothetical protein
MRLRTMNQVTAETAPLPRDGDFSSSSKRYILRQHWVAP